MDRLKDIGLDAIWARLHEPVIIAGVVGGVAVLYLGLVRALRWRRYNAIHKKYEAKWKAGKLTPAEAQRVMHVSSVYDMPLLLNKALAFALFKTYGIPTISGLLAATRELGSAEKVARRYADTEILIATWVGCPINGFHNTTADPDPNTPAEDPRASIAIARTNFLHSKYKISNDDYLYTLALFVLEPATWAQRYGWRTLSPMEQDAFFIFWQDVGKKMGITDIPSTLKELTAWSKSYEEVYMVPDESNNLVAGFTTGELLYAVPKALGLKAFGERIVIALLEERVRIAMLLPAQPRPIHWLVETLMNSVWIYQRWFSLPRRDSNPQFSVTINLPKPDANGEIRLRPVEFRSTPWYKGEPTTFFGRGLSKLLVKLGYYGDVPAPKYHSKGYRIEEVGPQSAEGVGIDEVMRNAAKIQGCPIAAPWAPKTTLASSVPNPHAQDPLISFD